MKRSFRFPSFPLFLERVFFFSSRRRHTRLTCDWSSDVCSSEITKRSGAKTKIAEKRKPRIKYFAFIYIGRGNSFPFLIFSLRLRNLGFDNETRDRPFLKSSLLTLNLKIALFADFPGKPIAFLILRERLNFGFLAKMLSLNTV